MSASVAPTTESSSTPGPPPVPDKVARLVAADLRRIERQRYASVWPTALGGGMLCAVSMIESGLPFAWLGFVAGFVVTMCLSVWALDRHAKNLGVGEANGCR